MNWLTSIASLVEQEGAAARAVIIATRGPTPRSVGTAMLVSATHVEGRIGRGEAQGRVLAVARKMIADVRERLPSADAAWRRTVMRLATGDVLGEHTAGEISVLIEAFGPTEVVALGKIGEEAAQEVLLARGLDDGVPTQLVRMGEAGLPGIWASGLARLETHPLERLALMDTGGVASALVERLGEKRPAFYVYGTGLVARALVDLLATLPFEVVWIDTMPGHFPQSVPQGVTLKVSRDLDTTVSEARPDAFHAVMTSAHDIDLELTRLVLQRERFRYLGVIGSGLKRERLIARLGADGLPPSLLARVICPIGLGSLRSKSPPVIAVGIAAQALSALADAEADGLT